MMYWIIHSILLLSLSFQVWKYSKNDFPHWVYWSGLCLKLSAGVVLGFIFFDHYGHGDTITFFEAARDPGHMVQVDQPRTEFFIKLIAPLVKLSGDSYWITSLWLSFLSFCSCWYLIIVLTNLYPSSKYLIGCCFLFIPTVIFWSSGMLKDTIAFSAVALIVAVAQKFYHKRKIRLTQLILLIISGFLLIRLKHYLFIVSLIYGGILLSITLIRGLSTKWKWGLILLTALTVTLGSQTVHPYLKINRLAWAIYENNQAITQKTEPAKQLDLVIESDSWWSVIQKVPLAVHIGLFRPSFIDKIPKWGILHQIENFVLSVLIISSLILILKNRSLGTDTPMVLAAIFCILILATLLPLSTPNFGTLVRYKNVYYPYLLLLSSILPYEYFTSKGE